MLAIPLLIILITSILGITIWGGMDNYILFLPASFHDLIFLSILAASIDLGSRRKSYHCTVCWFVALLFVAQSFMQIVDFRPPGGLGSYDLYYDNIVNGVFLAAFMSVTAFMIKLKRLRWDTRMRVFYGLTSVFLASNLFLTVPVVRSLMDNYAFVYDIIYYSVIYFVVLSSNGRIGELIRYCLDGFGAVLRGGRVHLR